MGPHFSSGYLYPSAYIIETDISIKEILYHFFNKNFIVKEFPRLEAYNYIYQNLDDFRTLALSDWPNKARVLIDIYNKQLKSLVALFQFKQLFTVKTLSLEIDDIHELMQDILLDKELPNWATFIREESGVTEAVVEIDFSHMLLLCNLGNQISYGSIVEVNNKNYVLQGDGDGDHIGYWDEHIPNL